jgi:hypothetical protein
MEQPRFANGRSVRNWLDRVRMRHAMRLYEAASGGRRLTKRDLVTIAAEDVRKSRVFQAGSCGADQPDSDRHVPLGRPVDPTAGGRCEVS